MSNNTPALLTAEQIARIRERPLLAANRFTVDALIQHIDALEAVLAPAHLHWILARMINVHGENPNADYIVKLREIVDAQRNALRSGEGAAR